VIEGTLAYLFDEHVDLVLVAAVRRAAPHLRVARVGDEGAPRLGCADPDILVWCERNDSILVTNNRHSMPGHVAEHIAMGGRVPGVFVLSRQLSIGEAATDLAIVAETSLVQEYRDAIWHLPLSV
jgi:hypothetical protein